MEGRVRTRLMSHAQLTIPELDQKGLREFALVTGGIVAVLFGLVLPWLIGLNYPVWPWGVGGGLVAWGLVAPATLRPVYRIWMRFGLILNRITTPLILGVVFYLLIAPVGLAMRLLRRDPMARRLDDETTSFRVASRKAPKQNMEKPF